MKFGAVAVAEAEGGILAHSVPLRMGRLRKGRVLSAADIAELQAAGHARLTLAQLEPGDMHEDDAAITLARALVPDEGAARLELKAVGTGRVNIVAAEAGLVALEATQIHAVNRVDAAITLATLPNLMRVEAGAMVATVKIIPYGVQRAALSQAAEAARRALRLHPPVLRRVTLVQTRVDALETGAKGHAVTAARLERLGVTLTPLTLVAHETEALRTAIAAATGEAILILTGSATSDLHDTAPEALRQAGGEVVHFGMPVDPGNLLFIGQLGTRPVIGLPGCAKSPALNGADWVLERIICGLAVGREEIMGMGVGGLLKEIPTRPRPRRLGEMSPSREEAV